MLTANLKILFLALVCNIAFYTTKCNADAVDVISSSNRCPLGALPKYLPHETDCSLFYACLHGKATLRKCPPTLQFNQHAAVCDHPENVVCQKDSQDKLGREINDQCPSENSDQPVLLPHKKDCGKFYICDAGVPRLKSCQPGLHFNPALHTCDYPERAGCDSGVNRKGREGSFDDLCPLNEDGNPILRRHETDCRKFYTCSNGITLVQVCQHGLHFNAKLQACDYPENAGCGTGFPKEPKGKFGKDIFEEQCPVTKDGKSLLVAHATDCRKFYTCTEGVPHLLICQSGLHFNPKLQACDYPDNAGCENVVQKKDPTGKTREDKFSMECPSISTKKTVLVPHPKDCSKFFICESGIPHHRSCPVGLHFSTALQACDYPDKVQCDKTGILRSVGVPSPFCPEVSGKSSIFYRHPFNCSVYYLCSNGLAYEFVCPARLQFNRRLKQCDYEDVVMCFIDSSEKNE